MLCTAVLLASAGFAIMEGLNPNTVNNVTNQEVQLLATTLNESIQQVQAQLTTNLDQVFYALQKPSSYILSVLNGTIPIYTMQNGTNGALTYFSSTFDSVANDAVGNCSNGGTIWVKNGYYPFGTTISLYQGDIFEGESENNTRLNYTSSGTYAFACSGNYQYFIQLNSFTLYVNQSGAGGISFSGISHSQISNVRVLGNASDTVNFGILFNDNGYGCYFNQIINCQVMLFGYGLQLGGQSNLVQGGSFSNCYQIGISLPNNVGNQSLMENVDCENNYFGIADYGIGITQNEIVAPFFGGNIFDLLTSSGTYLDCYSFPQTANTTDVTAGTCIFHGFGWEAWGVNSTAADGGHQTFVMGRVPTEVFVTSGNTTAIDCGAVSLTQTGFVYSLKGLAGTGQTGQTVYWYAVYKP